VAQSMVDLYKIGYVLEHEGNVSAKANGSGSLIITPSQLPRHLIRAKDTLVVNDLGKVIEGNRSPSVETGMHLRIYSKRPDVGAVMHFHSLHATALASLHETIPPFLEELVPFLGRDVPTVAYALAGTEELANNVATALSERNAVLLANHGAVVCGRDLADAMEKAKLLEKAAAIYIYAKGIGSPKRLPDSAVEGWKSSFKMKPR
jgi:L-fuculose-phosphate aldolase